MTSSLQKSFSNNPTCASHSKQTTQTNNTHKRVCAALFPGLPGWKVKPIWILLKQETVSGSGISWHQLKQTTWIENVNGDNRLQKGCTALESELSISTQSLAPEPTTYEFCCVLPLVDPTKLSRQKVSNRMGIIITRQPKILLWNSLAAKAQPLDCLQTP